MGENKICAVTGHRNLPSKSITFVRWQLEEQVERSIGEGYNWFLSGMAIGTDLIFANVVADLRDSIYPCIHLEAVIPYAGWLQKENRVFQNALARADSQSIVCSDYIPSCFMKRNKAMVDRCEMVLGVTDGRVSGGTANTIKYAHKVGRLVRLIRLE